MDLCIYAAQSQKHRKTFSRHLQWNYTTKFMLSPWRLYIRRVLCISWFTYKFQWETYCLLLHPAVCCDLQHACQGTQCIRCLHVQIPTGRSMESNTVRYSKFAITNVYGSSKRCSLIQANMHGWWVASTNGKILLCKARLRPNHLMKVWDTSSIGCKP